VRLIHRRGGEEDAPGGGGGAGGRGGGGGGVEAVAGSDYTGVGYTPPAGRRGALRTGAVGENHFDTPVSALAEV
jgi:hypothetical protein